MAIKFEIMDFIKTGKLGPIDISSTQESVLEILGEPEDISISRKPRILKYGTMELSFFYDKIRNAGLLRNISLYFDRGPLTLPKAILLEGWQPNYETTYEELIGYMSDNKIIWEVDSSRSSIGSGSYFAIISCSDVVVYFDIDNNCTHLSQITLHK